LQPLLKSSPIALTLLVIGLVTTLASVVLVPKVRETFPLSQPSASSSTLNKETVNNWLIYALPTKGIKIKYPENWEKQNLQNPVTKEVAIFLPPQETNSDQEKFIITIDDSLNRRPLTLNEYTNLAINEVKRYTKEADIIESRSATLANSPAHMVIYSSKEEPESLIKLEIWTLKNKKAYIITYTAEKNKYFHFLKTVKEMIKSFEITEF
jgi:serine/threonine-protein kinase